MEPAPGDVRPRQERRSPARHARPASPLRRDWPAVVAIAAAVATTAVEAQETGTLRGTVTLVENGGPVDGAVILVLGTGAFTFTDDGVFEITNVPAGAYEVTAERERLTAGRQTVAIAAGETATVDFELRLSPIREVVNVIAEATVGAEATLQAFNAVTTLDSFELARESPNSIGEALEDEPGIANRSFGPGSSRPIVRGEPETRGYSVVNLDASYIWPRQHVAHVLSFTGYNLTNALFRNHTSFIKDLAPEMGRGVKVGYSLRFF